MDICIYVNFPLMVIHPDETHYCLGLGMRSCSCFASIGLLDLETPNKSHLISTCKFVFLLVFAISSSRECVYSVAVLPSSPSSYLLSLPMFWLWIKCFWQSGLQVCPM